LNTAGAQVKEKPEEVLEIVLGLLEKGEKNESNT
jgi:hypothetical protein